MADPWLERPWRLPPNRISRFYRGGLLLDGFRGEADPRDTDRPEDWLGSATRAWSPPGTDPTDEGLGTALVDGVERPVVDVLASDPLAVAGPELAALARTGAATTGILVKLLDAGIRLPVHLHPTRPFARRHLHSPFGKAEAWIVLATRDVAGEPEPHVRLGFRRDVERQELRGWIERQQSAELLEAMHHSPTRAGDVWFVPPGTPHAIGAGVFILEVQEPTDFSIVLETAGFPIRAEDAHLGLGWDVMLDAVDRKGLDAAGLAALRSSVADGLPGAASRYFAVRPLVASGSRSGTGTVMPIGPALPDRFVVGVVTAGSGTIRTPGGSLDVRRGDAFAVPAAVASALQVVPGRDGADELEILACVGSGSPA